MHGTLRREATVTVKIVRRGRLPQEIEYQADCYGCKTLFTFAGVDAKFHSDQRDGDYYEIKCPVCNEPVTVNVDCEVRRA